MIRPATQVLRDADGSLRKPGLFPVGDTDFLDLFDHQRGKAFKILVGYHDSALSSYNISS